MDKAAFDKLIRLAGERVEPGTPAELARRMVCHLAEIEDPETPVGIVELHVAQIKVYAGMMGSGRPSSFAGDGEGNWVILLARVAEIARLFDKDDDWYRCVARSLECNCSAWLWRLPGVRRCRVCGCTEDCGCIQGHVGVDLVVCHWVDEDLCSECVAEAEMLPGGHDA
jgi:hypothetical protein